MAANQKEVTLVLKRSLIGRSPKHIITAKTLGLTKIGKHVTVHLNDAIQGMIDKISYLIEIQEK